jgi:MFS family permease
MSLLNVLLPLVAASIPGLLLLGYLSDKTSLRLVISLSCFGTALSCLLLWGFATNTGVLLAFVIMFGLLGLSFSALWTKLITVIARESRDRAYETVRNDTFDLRG